MPSRAFFFRFTKLTTNSLHRNHESKEIRTESWATSKSQIYKLPEGGGVAGDDDQLGLSTAEGLEGLLVSEAVLSRLHDHGKSGVDVLRRLLLQNINLRL